MEIHDWLSFFHTQFNPKSSIWYRHKGQSKSVKFNGQPNIDHLINVRFILCLMIWFETKQQLATICTITVRLLQIKWTELISVHLRVYFCFCLNEDRKIRDMSQIDIMYTSDKIITIEINHFHYGIWCFAVQLL